MFSFLRRATLVFALSALGLSSAQLAHADPVEVSDQARQLFREGVALLKKKSFAGAYEKFKAAYADSPSPKILSNLGLAAKELERDGEAINAYQRYLDQVSDIRPIERIAITQDLKELNKRTAFLTLQTEPANVVVLDQREPDRGEKVDNRYVLADDGPTLGLRAGRHRLRIEAEGYQPVEVELSLQPGQRIKQRITLVPVPAQGASPPDAAAPVPVPTAMPVVANAKPTTTPAPVATAEESGGVPAGVWVGIGVTAALGIGAGVTGGLALANKGDFDDAVAAGDFARAEELRDNGRPLNITTDVLLGSAGAAALITTILAFTLTSGGDDGDSTEDETPVAFRVTPHGWAAPTGAGAGLVGSF